MWLVAEKEITLKHAGKTVTVPEGAEFNAVGGLAVGLLRDKRARKLTADEKAAREDDETTAESVTGAEPVELLAAGKVPVVIADEPKAAAKKGRR